LSFRLSLSFDFFLSKIFVRESTRKERKEKKARFQSNDIRTASYKTILNENE